MVSKTFWEKISSISSSEEIDIITRFPRRCIEAAREGSEAALALEAVASANKEAFTYLDCFQISYLKAELRWDLIESTIFRARPVLRNCS